MDTVYGNTQLNLSVINDIMKLVKARENTNEKRRFNLIRNTWKTTLVAAIAMSTKMRQIHVSIICHIILNDLGVEPLHSHTTT